MSGSNNESRAEQILFDIRSSYSLAIESILTKHVISMDELHLHLREIESWGYVIQKHDDSLLFQSAPDMLIDSEIAFGLQAKTIGNKIVAFQTVQSTNDSASKLAEQNATEGTIVVSEKQTQGKGRFGRHWQSIASKGIYCSIILRPTFSPEFAPGLSLMTAVALADSFDIFTQAKIQIKWPNDLLLNSKKVAGILTELSADKNKINHVIVGVGININHSLGDFDDEIQTTATSLAIENKAQAKRVKFLQTFLLNFENRYEQYKTDRLHLMHDKLRTYSSLLGKKITLTNGKETMSGKVVDINQDGALVLESAGKTQVIHSGEVTIVKQ